MYHQRFVRGITAIVPNTIIANKTAKSQKHSASRVLDNSCHSSAADCLFCFTCRMRSCFSRISGSFSSISVSCLLFAHAHLVLLLTSQAMAFGTKLRSMPMLNILSNTLGVLVSRKRLCSAVATLSRFDFLPRKVRHLAMMALSQAGGAVVPSLW